MNRLHEEWEGGRKRKEAKEKELARRVALITCECGYDSAGPDARCYVCNRLHMDGKLVEDPIPGSFESAMAENEEYRKGIAYTCATDEEKQQADYHMNAKAYRGMFNDKYSNEPRMLKLPEIQKEWKQKLKEIQKEYKQREQSCTA